MLSVDAENGKCQHQQQGDEPRYYGRDERTETHHEGRSEGSAELTRVRGGGNQENVASEAEFRLRRKDILVQGDADEVQLVPEAKRL